ncbi:MAG: ABC transporter ATP-binding protein [Candidatus Omnitrophica bacterium]|nr:ABC transporter ATP-binding protein [Candidatus Omnitrophota bacterium]
MKKEERLLLQKFLRYLAPYWRQELTLIILSVLAAVLPLVNPYLTKLVIDKAFGNQDFRLFVLLVGCGAAVFLLTILAGALQGYLDQYIKARVRYDLSQGLFRHLERLDLAYFQEKSSAEHLYKIGHDIDRVKEVISRVPQDLCTLFPRLLLTFAVVWCLDWKMAILSFVLAPLLYLPFYFYVERMKTAFQRWIRHSEALYEYLSELFSHMALVKAFGGEKREGSHYRRKLSENTEILLSNSRLEAAGRVLGSAANKAVFGCIVLYGGYGVIRGGMTLGSLTAIMVYIGQLIGLQGQFAWFFQTIATGVISCGRIDDVLSWRPVIRESEKAQDIVLERGAIAFKGINFGYREEAPVLRDISFEIAEGCIAALVGPSGCGKTTIINLLLRLYDVNSGAVLVDGHDVRDIRLASFRRQVGIALQEPMLWDDTIENNIRYGKPEATGEEVRDAARICGIDGFVRGLPGGYQTIVGEDACKISEGQKQRIAIARALIRKPNILILDEAMSSIDSAGEEDIMRQVRARLSTSTIIIISHRWSSIRKVDKVHFLKRAGSMVTGSPEELLENDQDFRNLFLGQTSERLPSHT